MWSTERISKPLQTLVQIFQSMKQGTLHFCARAAAMNKQTWRTSLLRKWDKYELFCAAKGNQALHQLTFLLIYSMQQNPSWEAYRFSASQEIPAFYGTRRFITAFTSAPHISLSWASSIQYIRPHPSSWRSILLLISHLHLGLPSSLFPSGFQTKTV